MTKKLQRLFQARIGSSRLKGKVLKKLGVRESILILLERLSRSRSIEKIIVAIPKSKEDKKLKKTLERNGYLVFEGSNNNVLNRYYKCAKKFSSQHILRITGDCVELILTIVDKIVNLYKIRLRLCFKYRKRTFPDGMDIEIFSLKYSKKRIMKA